MALKPIVFSPDIFRSSVRGEVDRSRRALTWLMYGLSQINREYLIRHPNTPRLYDSGVRYKAEKNTENWQDIPNILMNGYGDCEDLACYRIGELQADGIRAMPFISWRPSSKTQGVIYHALVRYPDGRIEDPSRALGMTGYISDKPIIIGYARKRMSRMIQQSDMIGFSFKSIVKKFKRVVKKLPVRPKALVALASKAGPGIAAIYPPAGPALAMGMQIVKRARKGNKVARGLIRSMKSNAASGNSQAKKQYGTVLAANKIINKVNRPRPSRLIKSRSMKKVSKPRSIRKSPGHFTRRKASNGYQSRYQTSTYGGYR